MSVRTAGEGMLPRGELLRRGEVKLGHLVDDERAQRCAEEDEHEADDHVDEGEATHAASSPNSCNPVR